MPYIAIEAGAMDAGVKRVLIERLTEVAAETMGIPREYFFVAVHELPNENIAIGGKDVTTLKAEISAKA